MLGATALDTAVGGTLCYVDTPTFAASTDTTSGDTTTATSTEVAGAACTAWDLAITPPAEGCAEDGSDAPEAEAPQADFEAYVAKCVYTGNDCKEDEDGAMTYCAMVFGSAVTQSCQSCPAKMSVTDSMAEDKGEAARTAMLEKNVLDDGSPYMCWEGSSYLMYSAATAALAAISMTA
jgi:hypothetical protein